MKIGFAQERITPEKPCKLAGYAAVREMEDVHDDLFVRVCLFELQGRLYGIVAFDLIAVDHLLIEQVKSRCFDQDIHLQNTWMTAIHTHAGPMGVLDTTTGFLHGTKELMGETKLALIKRCADAACSAICHAYTTMCDGTLSYAYGGCEQIGSNRNDQRLAGNHDLFLIECCCQDRKALITMFACHPTVLGATSKACSADFCGAYAKRMEAAGYEMCMYLNGSCGDISTRFTRAGSGFAEVERLGKKLAEAATAILASKKQWQVETIKYQNLFMRIKGKEPKPLALMQQTVAECEQRVQKARAAGLTGADLRLVINELEAAQADLRYTMNDQGIRTYEISVEMVMLSDEIFIGIPGELFSELSNPIQDRHTHIIGYMNGYYMYFADRRAYEQHWYEAASSPFAYGESERMMQKIEAQIKEWRKTK